MNDSFTTMTFNRPANNEIRNQYSAAATILILLLMFFYRDVVFGGRTFLMESAVPGTMPYPPGGPYGYTGVKPSVIANDPGAIAWQTEPFSKFISVLIKKGDFPLWNPYTGLAGSPLFADGYTAPFEPLQFLFFLAPDRYWPYAIDIQLLLRFFIAGFSCYLFIKGQGISFIGSISAASLFMLSSYFVAHGNHPQVKTEMLLPLVMYGYDRLTDITDAKGPWICALLIGWAIISGMPESTFFSLLLGTLWYFYKCMLRKRVTAGNIQSLIAKFIIFSVVGVLISSVFLAPFLEFVLISKTSHSVSSVLNNYPVNTGNMIHPLWHLPMLVFQSTTFNASFYLQLGYFSLFVLVFSLFNLKEWVEYRPLILFFGVYCIGTSLLKFDLPIVNWIRFLPVLNLINLTKYPSLSIVFCLAILVGVLVDGVKKYVLSYKKVSLSVGIVLLLFIVFPVLGNPDKSLLVFFSDVNVMYVSLGVLAGITAAVYILAYFRNRRVNHLFIQAGFLVLVICEPFYWGAKIIRPNRMDPFQAPPFVQFLHGDRETFRILGLDSILYPNISTAYQIADIRWLNALLPQRAGDFTSTLINFSEEQKTTRFTGRFFPIADKMFDILNVKYILAKVSKKKTISGCSSDPVNSSFGKNQLYYGGNTLINQILQQNPGKKNFQGQRLDINNVTKTAIFAHPPLEFNLRLSIPDNPSNLDFSIGISPLVFEAKGDGVHFQITLMEGDKEQLNVFSKYIDPKNNPCDRRWFDEEINLDQWAGKNIIFKFSTDGGPTWDTSADFAYWGEIKLMSTSNGSKEVSVDKYVSVYQDDDVQIYQNENVSPRAFVVYNVKNVSTFETAMDQLADSQLKLRQTAIVENLPKEIESRINQNDQLKSVAGNAKLMSSGRVDVEVSTEAPSLLVVADQYYPGWVAIVDGKQEPIYAVDGIFRGVFLEKGDHVVQFKYRPLSFIIGAIISSLSLLIAVVFAIYRPKGSPKKYE